MFRFLPKTNKKTFTVALACECNQPEPPKDKVSEPLRLKNMIFPHLILCLLMPTSNAQVFQYHNDGYELEVVKIHSKDEVYHSQEVLDKIHESTIGNDGMNLCGGSR